MNIKKIFNKIKKIFNDANYYLYRKIKLQLDRNNFFIFLSQGLKNGANVKELIESILPEYENEGNKEFVFTLQKILFYIEDEGNTDIQAMKKAKLINDEEAFSMEQLTKTEPYKAYELINQKIETQDNLKWGIGMLFTPVIFILICYVIFQPDIKDFAEQMVQPINDLSTKKIEVPEYLKDRKIFSIFLITIISIMLFVFLSIEYLRRKNIRLLFKILKIKEREFVLNTFSVFKTLNDYGYSSMEAINSLEKSKDIVERKIFKEIKNAYMTGEKQMYEIFSSYGMDKSTVAYIRSGEMTNNLNDSLAMSLEYNKMKYDKLVSLLVKILPLIGQVLMTLVLLKPIIDLILMTTVGVLKFEV